MPSHEVLRSQFHRARIIQVESEASKFRYGPRKQIASPHRRKVVCLQSLYRGVGV